MKNLCERFAPLMAETLHYTGAPEGLATPLSEAAGKLKYVDPDCDLIREAKAHGISFGDE